MGSIVNANFNRPLTLVIEDGWTMQTIIEESQVPESLQQFLVITVNGTQLAPDQWESFVPRANDRVGFWIRPAGGDSGKQILRLVALVAVAVFAPQIGAAISGKLGVAAGSATALGINAGVAVVGSLLINALIPPPSINLPNGGDAERGESYFISSQSNSARPYEVVPVVYGKTKMIANLATSPQIFSAGQSSIFTALYDFGLGSVEIINVKAGDTRIEVFEGRVIRHYQEPKLAFDNDPSAGLKPFPLQLVNYPINSEDLNIALNKKDDVGIVGTAPDAVSAVVELFFPQGLAFYDDNGDLQTIGVQFKGYYRKLGNEEWLPWPNGTVGYARDHLAINVRGSDGGPNPPTPPEVTIRINGGRFVTPDTEFPITMEFDEEVWGVDPQDDLRFIAEESGSEFPFFEFVSATEVVENRSWEFIYKAPDQEGAFYITTNLANFLDAPEPDGEPFPATGYRSLSFVIGDNTVVTPPDGCTDVFCMESGNQTYVKVVYYSSIPTPQPYGADNPEWEPYIEQLQYQSFEVFKEGRPVVTNTSQWQDYAGTIRTSDSQATLESSLRYKNTHYHALKRPDIVTPPVDDGTDDETDIRRDTRFPNLPDDPDWVNSDPAGILGNFSVTGDETTQGKVSIIIPFPREDEYEIKVERISEFENRENSDQYFSSCYWSRIATRGFPSSGDNFSSGRDRYSILDLKRQHTMMELSFEAAETIQGNVQQISALVHSRLRWHDGERWQIPEVTSNPAWIVLDLLTGYSAQQNRYPYSLQDDECGYLRLAQIDIQSFIDFAAICDEPVEYEFNGRTETRRRYECNTVIASEAVMMDTVQNVLGMARAQLILGQNGLMQVMMDVDRGDQVRQVFTPSNSWGFSAERAFPKMPDALRIEFTSPELGYNKGEVIVYRPDIDPADAETFETLQTYGCTNWHQASWWGGYQMAQLLIRMETFTLNVMAESLVIQRGDVVSVASDTAQLGGGSHLIVDHPEPNVIVLSEAPYVYDDPYYTIRTNSGIVQGKVIDTDLFTVTLDKPINETIYANENALCVIGQKDLVTKKYIVNSIRPKADLSAELTLVVYDEDMYKTDDGIYPEWDAGGDGDPQDPNYGKYEVKNLQGFTYLDFIEQGYCQNPYSVSRLTWDVTPDDGRVAGFEIQWSRAGQTAVIGFEQVAGSTRVYEHKYQANSNLFGAGSYTVTPITQLGFRGLPMTTYVNKSIDRVPPDKPQGFYVSSLSDQIRFFWRRPDAIDIGGYQIYLSKTLNDFVMPDDAVLFATADCKAESTFVYGGWDQSITINYPSLATGGVFWIVCTDTSGNSSIPEPYSGLENGPTCPAIVEPFDLVWVDGASGNAGRWGESRWGLEEWGSDGRTGYYALVWKDVYDPYSEISHYDVRHTPEENADSLFDDKANVHSILDNVPAGVERLNLTEIGFEDVSGTFFIRAVNKRMCSGPWNRCALNENEVIWTESNIEQVIFYQRLNRAPYTEATISWAVSGAAAENIVKYVVTLYPQQYIPPNPNEMPESGRVNAVILHEGSATTCTKQFAHLSDEDLHFGVIAVVPYFGDDSIPSTVLTMPWQLIYDTEPPEAPTNLTFNISAPTEGGD